MEIGRGKGTDTLQTDNVFTHKEYIEREAAKRAFFKGHEFVYYGTDVYERLDDIPAADVVARDCYDRLLAENDELRKERPTAHSRWVFDYWEQKWTCLNCSHSFSFLQVENAIEECDYCPNCGARMDGDGE